MQSPKTPRVEYIPEKFPGLRLQDPEAEDCNADILDRQDGVHRAKHEDETRVATDKIHQKLKSLGLLHE